MSRRSPRAARCEARFEPQRRGEDAKAAAGIAGYLVPGVDQAGAGEEYRHFGAHGDTLTLPALVVLRAPGDVVVFDPAPIIDT